MKILYTLDHTELKAAVEMYLSSQGHPVADSDTFTLNPDETVTVEIAQAPVAEHPMAPGLVFVPPVIESATTPVQTAHTPLVAVSLPRVIEGHMVLSDPPLSATGNDTEFGYRDPGDNGIGFFTDPVTLEPYDTDNTTLVGISLPREILLSTFGISESWRTAPIKEVWNVCASRVQSFVKMNKVRVNVDGGGKSLRGIPLVDVGPTAATGNLIDLTEAAATILGTGGKAKATFELLVNGIPAILKGINFEKGIVG